MGIVSGGMSEEAFNNEKKCVLAIIKQRRVLKITYKKTSSGNYAIRLGDKEVLYCNHNDSKRMVKELKKEVSLMKFE